MLSLNQVTNWSEAVGGKTYRTLTLYSLGCLFLGSSSSVDLGAYSFEMFMRNTVEKDLVTAYCARSMRRGLACKCKVTSGQHHHPRKKKQRHLELAPSQNHYQISDSYVNRHICSLL